MEEKLAPLICCVDDEQINLKILESLLKKRGYRIVSAGNGVQALEVIRPTKSNLILFDIMMPEMDCYEVCAIPQEDEEHSYIPVIFVTAI